MTKQELIEQTKAAMRSGVHDISVEEIVEKVWTAALDEVEKRVPAQEAFISETYIWSTNIAKGGTPEEVNERIRLRNACRSQVLQVINDIRHE